MSQKIIYRLTVWATMPLTEDEDNSDLHTLESAASPRTKRQVERDIYRMLGNPSDYDCDVELMDFSVEDE